MNSSPKTIVSTMFLAKLFWSPFSAALFDMYAVKLLIRSTAVIRSPRPLHCRAQAVWFEIASVANTRWVFNSGRCGRSEGRDAEEEHESEGLHFLILPDRCRELSLSL